MPRISNVKQALSLPGVAKAVAGATLAGAPAAAGAGLYWTGSYRGDPRVSRADVALTRRNVYNALHRLTTGSPDIEVAGGLDRVAIPRTEISEAALPHIGFEPSIIAIPERGQTQIRTYRQPGTNLHLHKHKEHWFVHKDKHPSLLTSIKHSLGRPIGEQAQAAWQGLKHFTLEGIPGGARYIYRLVTGAPTYEEVIKGEKAAAVVELVYYAVLEKVAELRPSFPENTFVDMAIQSGEEKVAELAVEVCESLRSSARGLGKKEYIPENYGMLFKRAHSFWMKDVNFDLDILFLDKYGTVTEIQQMEQLKDGKRVRFYQPAVKTAALALEVAGGWCARHKVEPGHRLTAIAS
jgi:uncharacterized membrane protein (UPF0127 family)